MKRILFLTLVFIISTEFLSGRERETILFGFFTGRSYSTGHYENKEFKFGSFHGYNIQFYFSKYLGLKLEWSRQNKEVFYIYAQGIYDRPVRRKWDDWSLMLDIILKYPTRFFNPYCTLGFGGVEASEGEEPFPFPASPVARLGAGFKIGGKTFDILFLFFTLGISYFSKYNDGFLAYHEINIHNKQRWSIHYSLEFGF